MTNFLTIIVSIKLLTTVISTTILKL